MNKHTPGPWTANEKYYSDSVVVTDVRGFQVVEAKHRGILLGYQKRLRIPHWADKPGESYIELSDEEQAANAKLIAAAPELLMALKALLSLCLLADSHNELPKIIDVVILNAANVIIAKATGEEV